MTTEHEQEIDREDLPESFIVEVTVRWSHDSGVYLEPGHRYNGYGKGWIADDCTAVRKDNGEVIELTPDEYEAAIEKAAQLRESHE